MDLSMAYVESTFLISKLILKKQSHILKGGQHYLFLLRKGVSSLVHKAYLLESVARVLVRPVQGGRHTENETFPTLFNNENEVQNSELTGNIKESRVVI